MALSYGDGRDPSQEEGRAAEPNAKSCAEGVQEIFCLGGLEVMYAIVMYLHLERKQEIACRFSTCVFRSSFWSCSFSANQKYRKVLRVHA